MRVSDLFIYPLKSARAIALPAADIDAYGLPGDRRAMITDPQGHFITQRELPHLARIEIRPEASAFRLLMQGKPDISVPPPRPENRMDVNVWKSTVSAAVADAESNRQLSEWLGREVRLVFFDEQAQRTANAEWAGEGTPVAFTDGYQILVTTTGSLQALNDDLAAHGEGSVGMERFRPNIVIETDEAWTEDRWAAIEIAGIRFDVVKPCSRCIMTTQDQLTGSRDVANPMPAMGRIRMSADRRVPGPLFGWNVTPRGSGRITIGDTVKIVEERPEGWALKVRARG
ncbi:MOSC domain-containing protein [Rhizobium binae]|uniref:MOSC domain-containing protein n=1 Tax=Rhizobium binae TaxID=1138190 RepID=UPI001C83E0E6|nr:MOSC domain-containing protein [Rhizobium binae]MBX4936655.1 MOSC domain-containing protein [Rhizobium binae]MBX4942979.1 MOSC domain-containing protein [Rhizobium binae]MBX4964221.1 MOSC domain-containing protein [Rhizobium binae]MBX4978586.1 MOSC domain-containing protein [Rhizobium binae]